MIRTFNVSADMVRIAIICYREDARVPLGFRRSQFLSIEGVLKEVKDMKFSYGGVDNTTDALNTLVQLMKNEGREGVPKVALVFTDGG